GQPDREQCHSKDDRRPDGGRAAGQTWVHGASPYTSGDRDRDWPAERPADENVITSRPHRRVANVVAHRGLSTARRPGLDRWDGRSYLKSTSMRRVIGLLLVLAAAASPVRAMDPQLLAGSTGASVTITPGGDIKASTYNTGSF